QLMRVDGIGWDQLGQGNPSSLRTEYVIAFVSLGMHSPQDLTAKFTAAGVGSLDTTIGTYPVDAGAVGDIADAHCSIASAAAAGQNVAAARTSLARGNFAAARVTAPCASGCPADCG